MSAKLMLGKETVAAIKDELAGEVEKMREEGVFPRLDVIRVGERPEDKAYETGAGKRLGSLDIEFVVHELSPDVSEEEVEDLLDKLNHGESTHGILIFRPLPEHLDEEKICRLIEPDKDVDCLSPVNMAKVLAGDPTGFPPCTAEAAIEIGERNGIDFSGKEVTVVGRSMVVGRPLAMMLLKKDATVTVCHTRTSNIKKDCEDADVVISAAGVPDLIKGDMVKEGASVIDIGINVSSDGKLVGDADFDAIEEKASRITPVPGGVGSVTTSILARHVVIAAERLSHERDI